MAKTPDRKDDWYVNIPFSDLHKLVNQLDTMDAIIQDNAKLRREVEGLRNMYNDLLVVFGELRRELTGR